MQIPGYVTDIRADALAQLTATLADGEGVLAVIDALCLAEARARCAYVGPPLESISSDLGGAPVASMPTPIRGNPGARELLAALLPGETLEGVASALVIGEVRYRRTGLLACVDSADELVMPPELLVIEELCSGSI